LALAFGSALALGWAALAGGLGASRGALPAPRQPAPAPTITYQDFAGAESCAACHSEQYRAWRRSTHGVAGGPPTRERVLAPFDGRPMAFRDARVTPRIQDGVYVFEIERVGRPVERLRVAQVVGAGRMAGGGTQAYFAESPDGTLRFLPFDYSVALRSWFCATVAGWTPVTPDLRLADCSSWPPSRVLGSHRRYPACEQCHGSQISLAYDTTSRRYRTRFTTLAIDCEACHGPAGRHVELATSDSLDGADIGLRRLSTVDKDGELSVCYQCHQLKQQLRPGFLAGERVESYYSAALPLLIEDALLRDGRTRGFAYQEGHRYSDCYLNGSMRCSDCHEPHAQSYRDANGTPLSGRFDDGQCLACHESKREPASGHTHHRTGSPGARCVSCHMPYLQHPTVGPGVPFARSDHTISIPRPAYDSAQGIRGACAQCHAERSTMELENQVRAWYGEIKPHMAGIAALLRGDTARGRLADGERLLMPEERSAAARAAGLVQFTLRYLAPDLPDLEQPVIERMTRLAENGDADTRALALAFLHLARGNDRRVRGFLRNQLLDLGETEWPVRYRWSWIANTLGEGWLARGQLDRAEIAFARATEVAPRDSRARLGLGLVAATSRDYGGAVREYERAIRLDPANIEALVNLAFALQQTGRDDSALTVYRRALALDPHEATAFFSLGNMLARRGDVAAALEAYDRAAALNPRLTAAQLARAQGYALAGRADQARAALLQVLEFEPRNQSALEMLRRLGTGTPPE
jgi:tetratricopeptide (TPR) repeat protein